MSWLCQTRRTRSVAQQAAAGRQIGGLLSAKIELARGDSGIKCMKELYILNNRQRCHLRWEAWPCMVHRHQGWAAVLTAVDDENDDDDDENSSE